jgi:hypothetical protein
MRATKAGTVVGRAMENYDAAEVGKIDGFIKASYFNGVNTFEEPATDGLDVGGVVRPTSQIVLGKLLAAQQKPSTMNGDVLGIASEATPATNVPPDYVSEVITDRVIAGMEVITPKITTQAVATDILEPSVEGNVRVVLPGGSQFAIGPTASESALTIDAAGNFYTNGDIRASTITADVIRANRIEGIEIIASQLSLLSEQTRKLIQDTTALRAGSKPATPAATLTATPSSTLTTEATASALLQKSMYELTTQQIAQSFSRFTSSVSEFTSDISFKGSVFFQGTLFFNRNTAGYAVLRAGAQEVQVHFKDPLRESPIVSVTANPTTPFEVRDVTNKNFTIYALQPVSKDTFFSWVALSVKDPQFFVGTPFPSVLPSVLPSVVPISPVLPSVVPSLVPTTVPAATGASQVLN